MPSLFARLFAYRPRENRDPAEDFFTEALAGVLNANDALRKEFAGWVMNPVPLKSVAPVETQKSIGGGNRCDLWLDARDEANEHHLIVLENKIGAPADLSQLGRYANCLATQIHAASRTLLFVSPHSRSGFRPSVDGPSVDFRECRWYQVYDWLTNWVQQERASAVSSTVLVQELLDLMEEWNMDMKLSAADLAVAATYQLSAKKRLVKILDEVYAVFNEWGVEVGKSGKSKWSHDYNGLVYSTPSFGETGIYLEFGFDFEREEETWSVTRLGLPSIYFAIRGEGVSQLDLRLPPGGWGPPPKSWNWSNAVKVKQLSTFEVGRGQIRDEYLHFFLDAFDEAKQAFEGRKNDLLAHQK